MVSDYWIKNSGSGRCCPFKMLFCWVCWWVCWGYWVSSSFPRDKISTHWIPMLFFLAFTNISSFSTRSLDFYFICPKDFSNISLSPYSKPSQTFWIVSYRLWPYYCSRVRWSNWGNYSFIKMKTSLSFLNICNPSEIYSTFSLFSLSSWISPSP